MIGAVLHLCGRAVDRLTGADAARLRVTLAALSARVAAAEGEATALRWRLEAERKRATDDAEEAGRVRDHAATAAHEAMVKVTAERDAARDTVSELSYKLDAAGHEWGETEKERDVARADLATLRRLARDVLDLSGNYLSEKNGTADQARNALRAALPTEADGG